MFLDQTRPQLCLKVKTAAYKVLQNPQKSRR